MFGSRTFRRGIISLVAGAVIWEVTARFLVDNPLFFPTLFSVFERGWVLWQTGPLQDHIWTSFLEFAIGFLVSAGLGIAAGVFMALSRTVQDYADPWVSMLYATPTVALGPLFILWMGIGLSSKVAIIVLIAVFPILINTLVGLKTTDRVLLEVTRSFGASRAQLYMKVRIPAALPYIIAGLRVSVARALVGVVVAELFGARAGLGFLIVTSSQSFDSAGIFVGVLILASWGVLAVEFLKWLEYKLAPWRAAENEA